MRVMMRYMIPICLWSMEETQLRRPLFALSEGRGTAFSGTRGILLLIQRLQVCDYGFHFRIRELHVGHESPLFIPLGVGVPFGQVLRRIREHPRAYGIAVGEMG